MPLHTIRGGILSVVQIGKRLIIVQGFFRNCTPVSGKQSMSSDTLRVTTFDDTFYDFDKTELENVYALRQHLAVKLHCPVEGVKCMYGGKVLSDDADLTLLDRVYACITPQHCQHVKIKEGGVT